MTKLQAPANLVALADNRQISLSWLPSPGAVIYHVYRRDDGLTDTLRAMTMNTRYTDRYLINGKTYHYTVQAMDEWANSDRSPEVWATPFEDPITVAPFEYRAVVCPLCEANLYATSFLGDSRHRYPTHYCHDERCPSSLKLVPDRATPRSQRLSNNEWWLWLPQDQQGTDQEVFRNFVVFLNKNLPLRAWNLFVGQSLKDFLQNFLCNPEATFGPHGAWKFIHHPSADEHRIIARLDKFRDLELFLRLHKSNWLKYYKDIVANPDTDFGELTEKL